ncbi:DUF6427 family protein [Flavobacteriaceae bacterium]|nr:DUF6427 family protein [Flavobacteriaceae bacterium]
MLANFLKKTTVFNYVLVSMLLVLYLFVIKPSFFQGFSYVLMILILVFANEELGLVKFRPYFYIFLIQYFALFPDLLSQTAFLWSLMALIRMFRASQRTIDDREVFFDMGFWLGLSVVFVPETAVFLLYVLLEFFYSKRRFLNTLLALILGTVVPVFLFFTYHYINDEVWEYTWSFQLMNIEQNQFRMIFISSVIGLLIIHGLLIYQKVQNKLKSISNSKPIHIAGFMVCSLLMLFTSANNSQSVFVYFGFPWSVYISNYLAIQENSWYRETLLLFLLFLPLILAYV